MIPSPSIQFEKFPHPPDLRKMRGLLPGRFWFSLFFFIYTFFIFDPLLPRLTAFPPVRILFFETFSSIEFS